MIRVDTLPLIEAFKEVSTESCSSACERTSDCPGSFCKPNNHCQGLFWADRTAGAFCYHTESTPCNSLVPVHCDASGASWTTSVEPETTSNPEASTEAAPSSTEPAVITTALARTTMTRVASKDEELTTAAPSNANAQQQGSANSAIHASAVMSFAVTSLFVISAAF